MAQNMKFFDRATRLESSQDFIARFKDSVQIVLDVLAYTDQALVAYE